MSRAYFVDLDSLRPSESPTGYVRVEYPGVEIHIEVVSLTTPFELSVEEVVARGRAVLNLVAATNSGRDLPEPEPEPATLTD